MTHALNSLQAPFPPTAPHEPSHFLARLQPLTCIVPSPYRGIPPQAIAFRMPPENVPKATPRSQGTRRTDRAATELYAHATTTRRQSCLGSREYTGSQRSESICRR